MLDKIISKYSSDILLDFEVIPIAIADRSFKVIWYNNSFKNFIGKGQIKGRSIDKLFPTIDIEFINNLNINTKIELSLESEHKKVNIKSLKSKKNVDAYIIEIEPLKEEKTKFKKTEQTTSQESFQQEFQNILGLIAKENSLDKLIKKILSKAVEITNSNFGLLILQDEKKKTDFYFEDLNGFVINKNEIQREIKSSYTFISKWLKVNKKPLLAANTPNNLAYGLSQVLQCESLIISPCIFDDKLLGAVILGKQKGKYGDRKIQDIERLSILLSFSVNNITTRELNAALESRLMQSQKLETIGKLSSGMAHDFSNLLSSIFGSLNLLKKRVPQEENVTRLIDNIENCSIRAKDLTKGLLSFGKPTPKHTELIKPNFLLTEISKVITQTFPKAIEFESSFEENLYDVLGNGTEIYQVLLNLCVNAKEALDKKGKIVLIAKNFTINEKNITKYPSLNKGNYVHISVQDNGSGISEENIQRIFEPYFSTKEKETGSGLGLYVTYGIIKAHNGHIEVSSVINQGTIFDVYLPSFEPTKEEKYSPANKIILLADDEEMLRDLLAELLETNGYNVIKVSSGVEVLKVLTEEIKVDLAIIDYNMPEMNGLDCISHIRKLNFNIPIILSSGSLNLEESLDLKKFKIDGVLPKPYEFEIMLATIKKLI